MKNKLITVLLSLAAVVACAFRFAACGSDETSKTVDVTGVTLNKTELTLEVGGEETLTATVAPDNATDKTVTWSSSATAIATVANGKVTAVAAGTATITATTANDKTATCTVTVNTPAPITEVTAEQWKSALSQPQNFTMDFGDAKIEYDGVSLSIPTGGTKNSIITKDNGNYYVYNSTGSSWVRIAVTADYYTQTITGTLTAYAYLITMYADDYSSFAYAEGKYTCAELTKTLFENETTIKNIEITFSDGKLVSIKFLLSDGTEQSEINISIGTATVEIPANYTDSND